MSFLCKQLNLPFHILINCSIKILIFDRLNCDLPGYCKLAVDMEVVDKALTCKSHYYPVTVFLGDILFSTYVHKLQHYFLISISENRANAYLNYRL